MTHLETIRRLEAVYYPLRNRLTNDRDRSMERELRTLLADLRRDEAERIMATRMTDRRQFC